MYNICIIYIIYMYIIYIMCIYNTDMYIHIHIYMYVCVCVCMSWRKAWQPTPLFLSGESHGQRSLVGNSP